MSYRSLYSCRVCGHGLELVLDLGVQKLGGQFPVIGDPDPPEAPLQLVVCNDCGLAQLLHTVDPELMFREYGYRSNVTQTMTAHLQSLAQQAVGVLGRRPKKVLDVGCNDNTLLLFVPDSDVALYGIDPSDVPPIPSRVKNMTGFFPQDLPTVHQDYDLIFTVACFYDADDPVGFASAVRDRLAWDGLWCVEVADAGKMARLGGWDAICFEHLCYYEAETFEQICRMAGLTVIRRERNDCNGGSLRFYAAKQGSAKLQEPLRPHGKTSPWDWMKFAERVQRSSIEIGEFLEKNVDKTIHLLGASTKANTWLQAVAAKGFIQAASDRDPRKVGRMTPGTHIPIISEEESRAMKPDVYVVGPWQFKDEIVAREAKFLQDGGRLVFPLPDFSEVTNA